MKHTLFLISNHALKSRGLYNFSNNIAETKFHQFCFCSYDKKDKPYKSWEGIVSTKDLFTVLKPLLKVKKEN